MRFLHSTKPPRGPRSVLCVVEVTNSASGTGEGCSPTATRPAMCAMSTISTAPTFVGDLAKRLVLHRARIGAGAGDDHLRLVLARQRAHFVEVDQLGVSPHAVGDRVVELAARS